MSRRVRRRMRVFRMAYSVSCASYHAASAAISSSEKPLARRGMIVPGRVPPRKARISSAIRAAGRPASRGTGVSTAALAAWQPEQELAPGGAATPGASAATAQEAAITIQLPNAAARESIGKLLFASRPLQIVVHQRHRTDALAGCGEDRVEHGRGRD